MATAKSTAKKAVSKVKSTAKKVKKYTQARIKTLNTKFFDIDAGNFKGVTGRKIVTSGKNQKQYVVERTGRGENVHYNVYPISASTGKIGTLERGFNSVENARNYLKAEFSFR